VDIKIDASSIDFGNGKLNEHARAPKCSTCRPSRKPRTRASSPSSRATSRPKSTAC
jgi:hypothetical protein